MEHPRRKISKSLRALVWNTHIGEDLGTTKCLCGAKISQLNFECGHIHPHSRGGPSTVDNLYPICGMCNKSMGAQTFSEFVKNMGVPLPFPEKIPVKVTPKLTLDEGWVLVRRPRKPKVLPKKTWWELFGVLLSWKKFSENSDK